MPLERRSYAEEYHFKENDQRDRQRLRNRKTGPIRLNHQKRAKDKKVALIGWGIPSIEAMHRLKRPFVVVSLPEFEGYAEEHQIPFVSWDFGKDLPYEEVYKRSEELHALLKKLDVDHAVPIFEETVEWAGALNSRFRKDARLFDHSILFRDKAMMKRRAHVGGLRVGIFEEARNKEDVRNFFDRVNSAMLRKQGDELEPIHVKALNKAGASGHRMVISHEDIDSKLHDENFPSLMESHLDGLEVSCEAFIHKGKVRFLNITEYVVFGYSMMVPPTKEVEKYRPQIREEVQKIVDIFDIEYGLIHPEFFITDEGAVYFGEVAYRIPGGHIFDLMRKSYGFNPYEAHILCCDPNTTEEELKDIFPDETKNNGHAGSFLVYPKTNYISKVNIPGELEDHEYFDKHTLYKPAVPKIQSNQEGYGNHLGTIFFYGNDGEQVKQLLTDYVDHNFYI
ncbi:ATP-grasp domain-containing protein [Oceanobacillus senegalensis]|uniref:ATP-grasp domain-containing protein n=1 Tax=Oceanobacillus senegalensis TaxID=1936063 RepID=UPI000A30D3D3|nr:ATP-grasp domain-containing protein [Oceanobacillus senegalensis]